MSKESCLNCGKSNEILFCSECKEKDGLTKERLEALRLSMQKVLEIENNEPWYVERWMNLNRDDRNLTINQILGEIVSEAMKCGKVEALNYLKKCLSDDCEGEVYQTMQQVAYTIELVDYLIEEMKKSTN